MNVDSQVINSKEIFDKRWGVDIPKAAEAKTMMEILEFITKSTPLQVKGNIITIIDNKLLNNEIYEK